MASTSRSDPRREPAGDLLASWRGRLTLHRLAIVLVFLLALAFYLWTAATTIPFAFPSHAADIYNLLTTSFLHGHTYLPIKAPSGLLHLHNPYDPALNAAYSQSPTYHDLSFYNGHFYSQWGPTAVLTLFAPFRLTGLSMPDSLAVALFSFVGLACAVALLHRLVYRLLPDTPGWLLVVASAGLALTNVAPFLLRRPVQYEIAISSAYCFEMAGLLLIVMALLGSTARRRKLAFGSLCLGLAVGGRPTLVLGSLVTVVAVVFLVRRRGEGYRVVIWALGPLVVCGLLLGAYNEARFGSLTEFGQTYELAGVNQAAYPFYQLAYIPPGLFSYLVLPARLALTFPHAFLETVTQYPWSLPHDYAGASPAIGAEPVGGVLSTMPITLLLFLLPFLWWRRRGDERSTLLVASGLTGLALAIVTLVSWALFGTTQRYEVDFATLFLLAAFLVWAMLMARARRRTLRRRLIAVAGIALTAFGAVVGTAVSFTGYYDTLRVGHPGTFKTLEDITSPIATLATMVAGKAVIVRVDAGPIPVAMPPPGYGSFGERGADSWLGINPVTVTVIAPHAENVALSAVAVPSPGASRSKLVIGVSSAANNSDVPVIGQIVRLPVHLDWGLNRITLRLVGRKPLTPLELALDNIELSQ